MSKKKMSKKNSGSGVACKYFSVAGKRKDGRWLVSRPGGVLCSGSWASRESAQRSCDDWNAYL